MLACGGMTLLPGVMAQPYLSPALFSPLSGVAPRDCYMVGMQTRPIRTACDARMFPDIIVRTIYDARPCGCLPAGRRNLPLVIQPFNTVMLAPRLSARRSSHATALLSTC